MAKHLRIVGIVQGVGYRAWFQQTARSLHLSGWVRNRMDGSVEAMVAGDTDAIDKIIVWAWCGPAGARVDQVVIADAAESQITDGRFDLLPTG